jgi:GNAT superfamily N-acetyltransferase
MLELNVLEYNRLLPLLAGIQQKVLPYAVCEGINPGRVFADQLTDSQTALIWTPVGYYFLAGDPARAKDLTDIRQVLTEVFIPASQSLGETGFILIPSTPGWKEHLPALLPGREVIEIYRRPFAFDPVQFAARGDWRARLPQGFRLQAVDAALAGQVGVLASWASIEDFLSNGVGFALMDGEKVVSTCTSVVASRERVEIDVHTAEGYQRRGFAQLTASALIEACLQRGKQPNWECFWDNEASTQLAGKLGFSALPDYPVYYWEEASA